MLFRKLIRTAGRYKAQFISMIIMTALGIGMFLGFNMEWVSIENNMNRFFEETGFADYRIYNEDGFSEEDLEKILSIDGVEEASRYLSLNTEVVGTANSLALTVTENPEVSGFKVMEGEDYDENSEDGLWLFDKYADKNEINIGDELELKYETITVKGVVKGLIESSEYLICLQDDTQLMPDFEKYGYVYISPVMLKNAIPIIYTALIGNRMYPQINVRSVLDAAQFKEKVNDAMGKTLVILTKDETASYSEAEGEAEEGKTMGSILPVLFLLIAVLTMITTMHRIASNEKTQIGTLKALGFKDRKILRHYSSYTVLIGVTGTVLGIIIGYVVAWFIMNPDGMMGTYLSMPYWDLTIPWWCWLVMVLVILLMVVIGGMSVKQMMKGTAADALRPFVPKAGKPMLIEKTRLWEKLKFGTRWNLRDIMRHKSRSLVTLIGILGCMVLMVGAIGMYETADAFVQSNYTENARYSSKIIVSDAASEDDTMTLASEYDGDYSASISVQMNETAYSLDIYSLKNDMIRFMDRNNEQIELPDNGAFVCLRMQDEYGLKVGDTLTFSIFGTDEEYEVTVAGFNRSMTESIVISEDYAETLTCNGKKLTDSESYRISNIYTKTEKQDIESNEIISSVQSKKDIADSMDSFMDVLYTSVIVLVLAAIVLGVVVLYNLGVMSYIERYREMATLKVIGFKGRKIKNLLIGQNMWITVVGIIIGLFAGIGVINYLMAALASEYEMKAVVGPLTIIVSIAVTLGVSLLVSLMVAGKSRKIDMVVALKTPE